MTSPIRILHLEDDDNDAELIALHLASQDWPHKLSLVQTQAAFSEALKKGDFDVILADNSGPMFSGLDALALARTKCPDAAFLFVSGVAEGDSAMVPMKTGSDGFVLKEHLSELVPAIERALESKKK